MTRRPCPQDPSPAELEEAFAANVEWLSKFGPVLRRHMLLVGPAVESLPLRLVITERDRWVSDGRLVETRTGDYGLRLQPPP